MNQTTVGEMGEYTLLKWLNERLPKAGPGVIVPSGDDAAVVDGSGMEQLIMTTDTLVENIHFRHDWSCPGDVARKLVNMNCSDIAAMGGQPRYALIAATLRKDLQLAWLDEFYNELRKVSDETGLMVLGGDTTGGDSLVLTLTLIGSVAEGKALRFSTAGPGDCIIVTGDLGSSRAGLEILTRKGKGSLTSSEAQCVEKHLAPDSRWKAAGELTRRLSPTAMTDISDGLQRDLTKMADGSGLGFEVNVEQIPVNSDAREVAQIMNIDPLGWAICSGEEFELLLTVKNCDQQTLLTVSKELDVPLYIIGRMTDRVGEKVWIDSKGQNYQLTTKCFEHFL